MLAAGANTVSVRITGAWCERCNRWPARYDGICSNCESFLRAFPSVRALWEAERSALAGLETVRSEDPEFDRELQRWLEAA